MSDTEDTATITDPLSSAAVGGHASQSTQKTLAVTLTATAAVLSMLASLAWPIENDTVQASFFANLSGITLTAFGLVFTVCLVGTQLMSTPGRISSRHVLRPVTWGYFGLFMLTAIWSASLGYFANERGATPDFCLTLPKSQVCISQPIAGRIAILGFVASLLLLLPFISYLYYGISATAVFARNSRHLRNATSSASLERAARRFSLDLASVAHDGDAVLAALNALNAVAHAGPKPGKRRARRLSSDAFAFHVSGLFATANKATSRYEASLAIAVMAHERWVAEIIVGPQWAKRPRVTPKQRRHSANLALNCALTNLANWRAEETSILVARRSVQLIQTMATKGTEGRIAIRLTRGAEGLAECVNAALARQSESALNLFLRSLINLSRQSMRPDSIDIGVSPIFNHVVSATHQMATFERGVRGYSPWVLFAYHNFLDFLSSQPKQLERLSQLSLALVRLPAGDLKLLVRGTAEAKKHEATGSHDLWYPLLLTAAQRMSLGDAQRAVSTAAVDALLGTGRLDGMLEVIVAAANAYEAGSENAGEFFMSYMRRITEHLEDEPQLLAGRGRRRERRPRASP